LIIAKELTFAAQEGLDLILMRQPSWSALRDRLAFGQIDVAHLLSPMPLAMSLGLSGVQTPIDALMVLSVNGTVIGTSRALNAAMRKTGWANEFNDPSATSKAIFAAAASKLRIGVPFPFSMHRMLLEYWLHQDPNFDLSRVEIITVPPPQMAEAIEDGRLDMFCVGEPWGSVAVQRSDATLILPGAAIWEFAPEKVLGARREWVSENVKTGHAMIRAIYKATMWLNQPENVPLAVEILARSQHLDLPDHAIDPAFGGNLVTQQGNDPMRTPNLVNFHGSCANFPWRSQASWIADRLAQWHDLPAIATRDTARQCFRPDMYRAALKPLGVDMPLASEKVEGAMTRLTTVASTKGQLILGPDTFFDGALFDFSAETVPQI
jgi:NitT/TauT family transport system ATP-binding protein